MTVRRVNPQDNSPIRLSGWKLVVAQVVIAGLILGALWLTGDVRSAIMVTVPLLVVAGTITIRSRD